MKTMFNWLNVQEAFDAVKRNKGSAGIDGRSIAETELHWQQHGAEIEAKLKAGTYVPSPVLGVIVLKVTVVNGCWGFLRYKTESSSKRYSRF
jgi:retron-type reverse transcriptase